MTGPTLFDVAQRANISKSTVSLVINGSTRVHPATAERVRAAIAELNYVPSRAARSLQSGRSHLIGVIVSDITNPYFAELVRSTTIAARSIEGQNYDVFVFDTDYDAGKLIQHLDHVREYRPDGLILLTTERSKEAVEYLEAQNLPAVLLNWAMQGKRVTEVSVDYAPGLALLVDHLIGLGHTRLVFVKGPPQFYSATARERAFRSVVSARSRLLQETLYLTGEFRLSPETGAQVVAALEALPVAERPTAIVASSDLMALSILRELQSRGWRVPEEISVAGIDDITLAEYTTPALTTLRLPRRAIAQKAVESLQQMIDDREHTPSVQVVTPRLILRESVGVSRPADAM